MIAELLTPHKIATALRPSASSVLLTLSLWVPGVLPAQERGPIAGTVSDSATGRPLSSVFVFVSGTRLMAMSDSTGAFRLDNVPAGEQVVLLRLLGYRTHELVVPVDGPTNINVRLVPSRLALGDIVVYAASRLPERIVEAPSALSVVERDAATDFAVTGQAPRLVASLPGVDVAQSGINDFHVNARGFNSTLNRRVLVLQDGRDVSLPFNGAQEWPVIAMSLDDYKRIEMVRGPGSALYGANAYNGVLNLVTPQAREVVGTRIRAAGGELATFHGAISHAGMLSNGQWGYKITAGLYRSDTWTRSRTNLNDLAVEYAQAIDTSTVPVNPPFPGFELFPLQGQDKTEAVGTPGSAFGGREALLNISGAVRVDRYMRDDAAVTIEGGVVRAENETGVVSTGRLQVGESYRPWGRVAYAAQRVNVTAWYTGRRSKDQLFLSSGSVVEESSGMYHVEGQYNNILLGGLARAVFGGSMRGTVVDSRGTLLPPNEDDRFDWFGALFGQFEIDLSSNLRFVATARVDDSDLFDFQFSPRGAVVWTPDPDHAIRFTVNKAFQTPNILEYFVNVAVGPPADFSALEAALRASPLGAALTGVPNGALFTNSAAIPLLALGNEALDVERITSYEVGYRGQVSDRLFVAVDAYYSRLSNFVSDLLPGANPKFLAWTAPLEVPLAARDLVAVAARDALAQAGQPEIAAGLTRLEDGTTAVVFSLGNAGEAETYGFELAAEWEVTDQLRLDANYSFFEHNIDSGSLIPGDVLGANTPKHKGNIAAKVTTPSGFSGRAALRMVDGYDWAAGVYSGKIPASQTVDVSAAYQVKPDVRLHVLATNLLDQQRYHVYGGSVIGRRVIGGVTVTF